MPGVTPEMVRNGIDAGIVGAAIAGYAADTDFVAPRWEGAAYGAALGLRAAAPTGRRVEP